MPIMVTYESEENPIKNKSGMPVTRSIKDFFPTASDFRRMV